jgi:hypothetical protein
MEETLRKAQTLLKQERYDEAYKILQHLEHPTAKKWIAQIDKLKRETQQETPVIPETNVISSTSLKSRPKPIVSESYEELPDFEEDDALDILHKQEKMNSYGAVRIISNIYRFFGYITFTLGILFGVVMIGAGILDNSVFRGSTIASGFTVLIGSVVTGISLIAVGQLFLMLLELVENGREQVYLLNRIADKLR